jgi:hypothetical protein
MKPISIQDVLSSVSAKGQSILAQIIHDFSQSLQVHIRIISWKRLLISSSLCIISLSFHSTINNFQGQKCKEVPLHTMESKGERKHSSYSYMTSALDRVSGQHHAPAALYPRGKKPSTHWIGGWVGPRADLDTEARRKILLPLLGIEPQ